MQSKKKLLVVSYEEIDLFIGLNTRLFGIINALDKQGVALEVAVPDYGGGKKPAYINGVKIHNVKMPNVLGEYSVPIFSRVIFTILFSLFIFKKFKGCKGKYSHVQSEQMYPFLGCFLLAKKIRSQVILDDPSMLEPFIESKLGRFGCIKYFLKLLVVRFEKLVMKNADVIVASSRKSLEFFANRQPEIKGKIFCLPNGVNADEFTVQDDDKIGTKLFFNCSLPYYQNMAALYNLATIIKHFNSASFSDYSLEIIVNNENLIPEEIQKVIFANNNISVLTMVQSLKAHLQDADIVVLPYERNHYSTAGSRLKALEAFSCGKVVFATPEGVDGIDGCRSGENLYLCSGPVQMAETIMKFIQNRENLEEKINALRGKARQLVEQNYSWCKLVMIYSEILKFH